MSHDQAKKELEAGTPPELVCAACPWDRLCVEPPKMTSAEVNRAIKDAEQRDVAKDPLKAQMPIQTLMTTITLAGRDTSGRLCPVFVLRLRSPAGRKIVDGLREQMRTFDEADSDA